VLDAKLVAELVELVARGRCPCPGSEEPVGELFSIVGQYLGDPDRAGTVQIAQEPAGICGGLGGQDAHEHPPCRPVDGHEQIAPRRLVRHLGQVFQVDIQEAGLVCLECLARLSGGLGKQRPEIAHAVPPQAPIQARPLDVRVQKFTANRQKVVERQQQNAAQLDNHGLLGRRQGRLQSVRGGRQVLNAVAPLPLARRVFAHPIAQRQNRCSLVAPRKPLTDAGCRRRVLVQLNHHAVCTPLASARNPAIRSRSTDIAMNNGRRRASMQCAGMEHLVREVATDQ
jgi:hypothetical protein